MRLPFTKPPTGGPFLCLAPPTRSGLGARRRMPLVHEFDARMNARPHTTRLLVQAIGPDPIGSGAGAPNHKAARSL